MGTDNRKKDKVEKDINNNIKGPGSSEPEEPQPPPAEGPEDVPNLGK